MQTRREETTVRVQRILVGICSCRSNRGKREAVRETWLSRPVPGIECRFFVGGGTIPPDGEPDVVALAAADDYGHLPQKVRAFFAAALATSDFDWLFKCDDDTYLALDRLHRLIDGAHELVGNEFVESRGSPSGGAGYLLSRRVVRLLADDSGLSDTGAEDVIVGKAAIGYGARALGTANLCWDRSRRPRPGNGIVTSHWCQPEHLRAIHAALFEQPEEIEAIHPYWRDRIHLYPSGYFARSSTACCGRWTKAESGALHLAWFDWTSETFQPSGGEFVMTGHEPPPAPTGARILADKTVFVRAMGRSGNQMFQYAYGLHLRKIFGCRLRGNLFLLDGFEGVSRDVTRSQPTGKFATIHGTDDGAAGRHLNDPLLDGIVLDGFFQNYRHIDGVREELRAMPGPVEKRDAIGVHVRRGDYLGSGHDMGLPVSYYTSGVRRIMENHPHEYRDIVVFTDDPGWCRDNLVAELGEILPASVFDGDERRCLLEMKSMRGMVIANSTFGWWGAWLADCPTIYPKTWPVPGGFYPPGLGCTLDHWNAHSAPAIRPASAGIAANLAGTWHQYNDGILTCRKTFFPDGRMCYGEIWQVDENGEIRFGDHRVRFTPDGALAGYTCNGVRLDYLRSAESPGPDPAAPGKLHGMISLETDRENPVDLLAHLVETGAAVELARFGPDRDGGYNVPSGIVFNKVFTIGVGQDIGFEVSYAEAHPETRFELFDHTVAGLPEPLPNSVFHKVGVGYGDSLEPLPSLLDGRISPDDTALLKIDCEGGEWHCGLDRVRVDGIHTLVLEVHDMLRLRDPGRTAKVLAFIADHFVMVHVSPNNCEPAGTAMGHRITNCMELTFVNRSRVSSLVPRTGPPPRIFRNVPDNPDARIEIVNRKSVLPTVVSAYIDIGPFQKGTEGVRNRDTYRAWLENFSRLENPLVFFAGSAGDADLVKAIRAGVRNPTKIVRIDPGNLLAFSQVARVRELIRDAGWTTAPPNTTVAEYSCVTHSRYELVARAVSEGWIGTDLCCWMDCGKIFDVLRLRRDCRYQFVHRPEMGPGIHYSKVRPCVPKSLFEIQSNNGGHGEYCYAGGFFYGATAAMAEWCTHYLTHAMRYQSEGYVFNDQATLYAMETEGLAGNVAAHDFPEPWSGLCGHLLRPVRCRG